MMKPDYSIVVPICNEEETIGEMYRRLKAVMDAMGGTAELLLVDDGSHDRSLELMRELHECDPRVCYISLGRNFGHQVAVTAGLNFAKGDAVVVMDGDLQDPPELIPRMVQKWREGYEIVYAQRTARHREALAKKTLAYIYYRALRFLTEVDIPADSGDFCLMDWRVVKALNALPERNRYLRGLRAWAGFRQVAVPFERDPRYGGRAKYTLHKSASLAITGIISFSRVPLRLATYLGLLAAGVALLMMGLVVYWRLFHPAAPLIGYTIITAAIFFLGAVQLLCLGILGEYLGRTYEEVKNRPLYTVKELAGISDLSAGTQGNRDLLDSNGAKVAATTVYVRQPIRDE